MKTSRDLASRDLLGRPDLLAKEAEQDQRNVVHSKDGKRKRKILGDRTNFSVYDLLQKKKKRKQVGSGEDKENIPPEEGFSSSTALVSTAVRKVEEMQDSEHQRIFACDRLKCRMEGHLHAREYLLPIARAMV